MYKEIHYYKQITYRNQLTIKILSEKLANKFIVMCLCQQNCCYYGKYKVDTSENHNVLFQITYNN